MEYISGGSTGENSTDISGIVEIHTKVFVLLEVT